MDDTIVISIFMALEGLHAFSAFLPSVFTIKTFVSTADGARSIREGEMMAAMFLAAVSATTAAITRSVYPALFGLSAGALMLFVYEKALRESPSHGGELAQHDDAVSYEENLMYYNEG